MRRGLGLVAVTGALVAGSMWLARLHLGPTGANLRRYSMPNVSTYDLVTRWLFRGRYREIAEAIAAEVPAGSEVLDLGCGPGEVLLRLATLAPELRTTGLDVDAGMLARAERKAARLPADGSTGRPRFVQADAASMPFLDASFDVVISSYALHHVADRDAARAEILRVLRPGGRAIVWDIVPPHEQAPDDVAEAHRPAHHDPHPQPGAAAHGPSMFGALRMLIRFGRIPATRFDFAPPAD